MTQHIEEALIGYVMRYGGMCRDCADMDGVCQSGMPCDTDQRRAVIRHTIAALAYGINNGFIASPFTDTTALAAAEERGRMEERERCSAAVPITTGMRELRVSLIARAVRQSLRNYGHKVAESTLPECVAADVERTLVADEKAWEAAPAKPPRDCGINGGDLLESRDNIGSAYTRSTTPPTITKEPTP